MGRRGFLDISEAVNIAYSSVIAGVSYLGQLLTAGVGYLEELLAPVDPVIFIFACFIVGVVVGLYFGKKKAFKDFFKMPSAHWRIRRKIK